MEKPKRKSKLNRRRWIIAILILLFGGCGFVGFKVVNFIVYINQEPYYDNQLLQDIEVTYTDMSLVEARLLEYVTIGESTRAEVEAFGEEHLTNDYYHPCVVNDEASQTCYKVARYPTFPCAERSIIIVFMFEDDVLTGIELAEYQICL